MCRIGTSTGVGCPPLANSARMFVEFVKVGGAPLRGHPPVSWVRPWEGALVKSSALWAGHRPLTLSKLRYEFTNFERRPYASFRLGVGDHRR